MDPDANLEEQLRLAQALLNSATDEVDVRTDAWRLAELVIALDEWVRGKGFLPSRWQNTKVESKLLPR